MTTVAFRVTGIVQGVGFRAWTCRIASSLGLEGWVRNVSDGAVEGRVSGEEAALGTFLEALQRGPRHARVLRSTSRIVPVEVFPDFRAVATAPHPTPDWP